MHEQICLDLCELIVISGYCPPSAQRTADAPDRDDRLLNKNREPSTTDTHSRVTFSDLATDLVPCPHDRKRLAPLGIAADATIINSGQS